MKANELSCKDLMVGDLVSYHGIVNKVAPADFCQEKWLKEIKPIPLTPEILEKMGFKRDPLWHHCDKDLDNYSISVQLGYANRIEYIEIKEKSKDNFVPSKRTKLYLTHIKYVHELQRALRLCRIKKEIIL